MKRNLNISTGIALFLLTGCISVPVSYVQTGPKTYDPQPEDCPIRIYLNKVPDKYEELGLAEARGGDLEMRYSAVKKKACQAGANGIIPQGENTAIGSTPVTQYHTANTSSGGMVNYSTTSTQVYSYVTQKFIIIRTPE